MDKRKEMNERRIQEKKKRRGKVVWTIEDTRSPSSNDPISISLFHVNLDKLVGDISQDDRLPS